MKVTLTIEGAPWEFAELSRRVKNLLGPSLQNVELEAETPDPRTMTINHPQRYRLGARVDDYGQRDAYDVRTGRRGAMMAGMGFVPGAIVQDDGSIEFEHPWDNPYH